jgi:hypothetical protein
MQMNKRVFAVIQAIAFLAMIAVNAMANILPLNGYHTGQISAMYPNQFVPAGFTFGIWSIIYLFLLAWVIYSGLLLWNKYRQKVYYRYASVIAPLFVSTCFLNISWILVWHMLQPLLSLFIMVSLLVVLIRTYGIMQKHRPVITGWFLFVLYAPFVIYLAWMSVATIANTTAVLVDIDWDGFGIAPRIWSSVMIVIATALAVWFGYLRGELAFAWVVAWALFGIYKGQHVSSETVGVFAIVGCVVCVVAGVMGVIRYNRRTALEGII